MQLLQLISVLLVLQAAVDQQRFDMLIHKDEKLLMVISMDPEFHPMVELKLNHHHYFDQGHLNYYLVANTVNSLVMNHHGLPNRQPLHMEIAHEN